MYNYPKPRLLISKCLGFDACRYDGRIIELKVINHLSNFAEFIPICPEEEIGLGIPREPIRIVQKNNKLHLIQPFTKMELTQKMHSFSKKFLDKIIEIDGIILKSKSPTCGISNVKIFKSAYRDNILKKGIGFFAREIIKKYPYIPSIDEKKLRNINLRRDFFTKIFSLARFRHINEENSYKSLIEYHSRMKYLLMAYNQSEFRILGKIIANTEKKDFIDVINNYAEHLKKLFSKTPKKASHINAINHMYGYFKKQLNKEAKEIFHNILKKYNNTTQSARPAYAKGREKSKIKN